MSYESMSIIEGKFKLPMLRGEHTSKIEHFREMEEYYASDLSNWLCNIYIEIRHMSLHELGATEEMLKSADFDLDYFNKVVISDSYIKNNSEAMEIAKVDSEKHKEMILKTPLTPFELQMSPSKQSEKALYERQFSTDEGGDDIEKQLGEDKNTAAEKKEGEGEAAGRKQPKKDELEVPLIQLPVDKGIFRRKVNLNSDSIKDIETGGAGKQVTINTDLNKASDAPSSMALADEEEQKKRDSSKLTSSFLVSSFLSSLGLKKQQKESGFKGSGNGNDPDQPLVLHANDSFYEHKQAILNKWKDNVKKKFPHHGHQTAEDELYDKNELLDVRERGYHLEDEAFLHKYQRGKLGGIETIDRKEHRQWAAAAIEGQVIRK
jgi:hypothetical protein